MVTLVAGLEYCSKCLGTKYFVPSGSIAVALLRGGLCRKHLVGKATNQLPSALCATAYSNARRTTYRPCPAGPAGQK